MLRAVRSGGAGTNRDGGTAVRWPRSLPSRHARNSARDSSGRAGAGGIMAARESNHRCTQIHTDAARQARLGATSAPARGRLCTVLERSASVHDRCGQGSDVWRGLPCGGGDCGVVRLVGRRRAGRRQRQEARRVFCRRPCGPGRQCRRLRRCDRRIGHCVREGGRYCFRRCGEGGIGLGVSERGVQPAQEGGKRCRGIRDARFGRHDFADVLGECGDYQIQGLGIAVLDRRVEDRTGLGAELGECFRGEEHVAVVGKCAAAFGGGSAAMAGGQWREPVRQEERERASAGRPAWKRQPAGRGGLRMLGGGVASAGLRGGRVPQGCGEGNAAANGAAHRAADPADEARTNPLAGLGSWGGDVERGWH